MFLIAYVTLFILFYIKEFLNNEILITQIYLGSYICACLPGFVPTDFNENGATKCEPYCALNNGLCQPGAHCFQECDCPSGYEVDDRLIKCL